jgi:hypothetical protein
MKQFWLTSTDGGNEDNLIPILHGGIWFDKLKIDAKTSDGTPFF